MTVFCTLIAGILCLQTSYPDQSAISIKAFNNGLGGGIEVQGPGWHAAEFHTDVLNRFDARDAKKVCVQDMCVAFHRTCDQTQGRVRCTYQIDTGLLTTFSVDADSKDILQRAARSIAIYRPGPKRESDFPLALLDQAAEADPAK